MNKRDAKELIGTGLVTFKMLKHVLSQSTTHGWSTINRMITKSETLRIFRAGIENAPDDEVIKLWSTYERRRYTKNYVIASNILREFGSIGVVAKYIASNAHSQDGE